MILDKRGTAAVVEAHAIPRRLWLYALVIGVIFLLAAAYITEVTGDTILVPNVIMVGSFLVPVCTVLFVLARPRETHLTIEMLVLGFLAGGTAGVVLSAVTEVYVLPDHVGTNALIGLIEEGGKILILLAVAQLVRILNILETEALRGALAPFGHITWTAILAVRCSRPLGTPAASASTGAWAGRCSVSSPCTACGTRPMAGQSA